jgi:hypothetical protein
MCIDNWHMGCIGEVVAELCLMSCGKSRISTRSTHRKAIAAI